MLPRPEHPPAPPPPAPPWPPLPGSLIGPLPGLIPSCPSRAPPITGSRAHPCTPVTVSHVATRPVLNHARPSRAAPWLGVPGSTVIPHSGTPFPPVRGSTVLPFPISRRHPGVPVGPRRCRGRGLPLAAHPGSGRCPRRHPRPRGSRTPPELCRHSPPITPLRAPVAICHHGHQLYSISFDVATEAKHLPPTHTCGMHAGNI